MTDLGPSPLRPFDLAQGMLCVFAGDIPKFDCVCSALGASWFEKVLSLQQR